MSNSNLTKTQAIELMKIGTKITHSSFTDDEWMTMENGKILLEDGVRCSTHEFWRWRELKCWDDGYSIWNDKK